MGFWIALAVGICEWAWIVSLVRQRERRRVLLLQGRDHVGQLLDSTEALLYLGKIDLELFRRIDALCEEGDPRDCDLGAIQALAEAGMERALADSKE